MPNYNKSFNFRNGVQVDEDNFYINANGLVGIGTTIPRYTLDLHGDASVSGLTTTRSLNVSGVATFNQISVGSSINLYASSGIVSAVKFYGDGSTLSNLPSSQWIDVDPTSAYVSIYSRGTVGIGTTNPSLPYILTVGQNPDTVDPEIILAGGVGFSSYGQIKATGIITAGQFSGPGAGITNINASNISFGTLNSSRLPSQINLATGIATIRDVVVSSAATISGVSTFTSHGLISRSVSASSLNISGVATASSTLEITTTGSLKFSGAAGIYIGSDAGNSGQFLISRGSGASGGVAWSSDISLSGIVTVGLLTATNIWSSGFTTTSNLTVTGNATIDTLNARRIVSLSPAATNDITRINSGIITTTTFKSSFSETGVTTSSSIDSTNLNVSGIGSIAILHSGNVRLNVETNTFGTVSGDLKLGAFTSTVNVEDNLKVDGSSILSGITSFTAGLLPNENLSAYIGSSDKSFSEAYIDDVKIGATASNQIDTKSGNLLLDSAGGTVNIKDNLEVDERLIVDGSSILSGISTFATGLLPDEDVGAYIGSSSKAFSEAHIDDVRIGAVLSNEIDTRTGNLILDSFAGTVEVDDNLDVNNALNVDGNVYLSGITTVANAVLPADSSSVALGNADKRFIEAHIDNVRIGSSAANEIDTRSGNLVLDSFAGTVEVDDNLDVNNALNVDGNVYLSGITTVAGSLLPNENNSIVIGSASKAFGEAHIDEVQIGLPSAAGIISTRSGNLTLDSFTRKVFTTQDLNVGRNLEVTGIGTISSNLVVGTDFLPLNNTTSSIGSTARRFSEAHIDDVRIGFSAVNEIDTRSGNLVLDSTGGTVEVDDNLDVNNSLNVDGNVYLTGIATVAGSLLPNENNSIAIGSTLKAFGEAHIDEVQIGLLSAAGIISTRSGNLTLDSFNRRVSTSQDLNVGRNLEVTGIGTFNSNLVVGTDFLPLNNTTSSIGSATNRFADAHIDDIRLGFSAVNEIDTRSGNLVLDSTGGTVEVDDNLDVNNSLNVDGNVYLSGITTVAGSLLPNDINDVPLGSTSKSFSAAYIDNVRIGVGGNNEIDTGSGNLVLDSTGGTVEVDDNLDVNSNLNVDGSVYLTGITTIASNFLPSSNGSANLGSTSQAFGSAYVANLQLGVNANEITTKTGSLNLKSFNNLINLENNVVISDQLYVTGVSTFNQIIRTNSGILPDVDLGAYIGSGTTAFTNAHIGNINIANSENNTISTKSGDLKLNSNTGTTKVLGRLTVDQTSELTGITSVGTGIIPTTDRTGYLGSSSRAFETAHINNIRIAVASTSTIDTISGDLVLQSASNYVQINDNLVVGSGLTVTNNITAGPLFVNSSTNRIGVGTLSPESKFDVVSADDNVSILIKTLSANNFPSLTLSSGSSSANIQFNELQDRTLKIRNQTPGPIVYQLHSGAAGINTGNHTWKYKDTDLMSLTYGGKLGIGRTDPRETFEVVGTSTVTGNSFVGGNLRVGGNLTIDGTLSADFGGSTNFNVGIITGSKLISLSSITSGDDVFVNRNLQTNNIYERNVNNGIVFHNITKFNVDSKHYGNVGINSGYNLNVYDSGTIVVSSNSDGSGVGTASTITTQFVASKNFYGSLFDGRHLNTNSAQIGIITVTNLKVTGVSSITFDDLTASSLTINSNRGVFIGQALYDPDFANFVGIGTTQKIGGVTFYSFGTVLAPQFIAGVSTYRSINNQETPTNFGVGLYGRALYAEDSEVKLFGTSTVSIGNSENSGTSPNTIIDTYGKSIIGIGTITPNAIIDFSNAGRGLTSTITDLGKTGLQMRFMLPPSITTTERVGLATVEGAFIFNTTTKKHQGYNGTAWFDFY